MTAAMDLLDLDAGFADVFGARRSTHVDAVRDGQPPAEIQLGGTRFELLEPGHPDSTSSTCAVIVEHRRGGIERGLCADFGWWHATIEVKVAAGAERQNNAQHTHLQQLSWDELLQLRAWVALHIPMWADWKPPRQV